MIGARGAPLRCVEVEAAAAEEGTDDSLLVLDAGESLVDGAGVVEDRDAGVNVMDEVEVVASATDEGVCVTMIEVVDAGTLGGAG